MANHDGPTTPTSPEPPESGDQRQLTINWTANAAHPAPVQAADAAEAIELLNAGSLSFSRLGSSWGPFELRVDPEAFGFVAENDPDGVLNQEPFAAVLSCSDARVPIEITLGRAANDVFVVRVAGNVPGSDCLGSLHYAADHLPTVRVFAVVGHSNCGAVTAGVDAMLDPEQYLPIARQAPLRGIIDSLLGGIRMAAIAIERATGDRALTTPSARAALIATATLANTALTSSVVARDLGREAAFGVYDLEQRTVGVMTAQGWRPGLRPAPATDEELRALIHGAAVGYAERLA